MLMMMMMMMNIRVLLENRFKINIFYNCYWSTQPRFFFPICVVLPFLSIIFLGSFLDKDFSILPVVGRDRCPIRQLSDEEKQVHHLRRKIHLSNSKILFVNNGIINVRALR